MIRSNVANKLCFVIAGIFALLPLPSFAECLRKPNVFPEGEGWLRFDAGKDYTFWWKFQPPIVADSHRIGRVIEATSDSLESRKPFAKFWRYSHIEFDCSKTNAERSFKRHTAYSMKPDSTFTEELGNWNLVEGNTVDLYIAEMACRDSSISRIKKDGSIFGVESNKYFYFFKRECPF